jgi:hypothetical protein
MASEGSMDVKVEEISSAKGIRAFRITPEQDDAAPAPAEGDANTLILTENAKRLGDELLKRVRRDRASRW